MAEPELFIDKAQSFIDSRPLLIRNANVWQRQQLQHLILFAPDGAQFILGPASLRRGHDFIFAGMFERPTVRLKIGGVHVDRRRFVPLAFKFRSEEHKSELQSLMRISYAVFCLKTTTTYHYI